MQEKMKITRIVIGPRKVVGQISLEDQAEEAAFGYALAEFCQRQDVAALALSDGSVEIAPSPTLPTGDDATARLGFLVRWLSGCGPEHERVTVQTCEAPNASVERRAAVRASDSN